MGPKRDHFERDLQRPSIRQILGLLLTEAMKRSDQNLFLRQCSRHINRIDMAIVSQKNEQSQCVVVKGAINKSLDIHLNRPWRAASSSSKRGLGSQCLVGCRAGRGKRKVQDCSHILGIINRQRMVSLRWIYAYAPLHLHWPPLEGWKSSKIIELKKWGNDVQWSLS